MTGPARSEDTGSARSEDTGSARSEATGSARSEATGPAGSEATGPDSISPSPAPAGRPGPGRGTVVHTAAELGEPRVRRAVVMTMGALHEGHATLVRHARELVGSDGEVVVTVFVNPLQFGAGEDLDRYPRTLDADVRIAAEAGADLVFAPGVEEVYPGGEPEVRISAGPMGERLEGGSRPGHFDGMLTVVAKLLHLTRPHLALYGQKDAQQLALIRRMVRDLNFGVEIVGVPTVREEDGLALSSRNRYLSPAERVTALALSGALFAGRDRHAAGQALQARAAETPASHRRAEALDRIGESRAAADAHAVAGAASAGTASPAAVRDAALAVLREAERATPPLQLDYLALVDPSNFTELPDGADEFTGPAVLAVAARVGSTRLIDNLPLTFGARP